MSVSRRAVSGSRHFRLIMLLLLGLALGVLTFAPGAKATVWGVANNNVDWYANDTPSDYVFQPVFTKYAAIGPASYQRFLVPWDVAGTYDPGSPYADSQGCVGMFSSSDNSHNNSLQGLINALSAAEQQGFTPVIAFDHDDSGVDFEGGGNGYPWPSGAQFAVNPTDWEMFCGAKRLAIDLGGDNLLPAGTAFESYNEPLSSPTQPLVGSDCGGTVTSSADCAARYYADVVSGLAWGGFAEYNTAVIAGTFKTVTSSSFSGNSSCDGQATWDASYVCYIEEGDRNGGIPPDGTGGIGADDNPLSSYRGYVHNWSFHDYEDLGASYDCTPGGGGCSTTDEQYMLGLMANSDAPGGANVWLTEAGCRNGSGNGLGPQCSNLPTAGTAGNSMSGNEAYDWLRMLWAGNLTAIFWYEYSAKDGSPTGDVSWDSGLEDTSGTGRDALCVIGSGGASWTSWSGGWGSISCTGH